MLKRHWRLNNGERCLANEQYCAVRLCFLRGVECNHGRWSGWFFACFGQRRKLRDKVIDRRAKVGRALGALERELEIFRTVTRKELLKPYEKCFDPETRALREDIARGGKGHPDMFAVQ